MGNPKSEGWPYGRNWIDRGEKSPVPRLNKRKYKAHNRAKLSVHEVNCLRQMRFNGRKTLREIAEHYDISISTVHQICSGKTWRK